MNKILVLFAFFLVTSTYLHADFSFGTGLDYCEDRTIPKNLQHPTIRGLHINDTGKYLTIYRGNSNFLHRDQRPSLTEKAICCSHTEHAEIPHLSTKFGSSHEHFKMKEPINSSNLEQILREIGGFSEELIKSIMTKFVSE